MTDHRPLNKDVKFVWGETLQSDWVEPSRKPTLPTVKPAEVSVWAKHLVPAGAEQQQSQEWYLECSMNGHELLRDVIEIRTELRGGLPVLKGTGFTVSQIFAELAETDGVLEVSEDFDLDPESVKAMLNGFSLVFSRPYGR